MTDETKDFERLAEQVAKPGLQLVFEALASVPRRKILAYLAHTDLTAGEIASRFEMSKPSISQHLGVLESAGLVTSKREGQFIRYALSPNNLANALNGFAQDVCPVSRPLKRESKEMARAKSVERPAGQESLQEGIGEP